MKPIRDQIAFGIAVGNIVNFINRLVQNFSDVGKQFGFRAFRKLAPFF